MAKQLEVRESSPRPEETRPPFLVGAEFSGAPDPFLLGKKAAALFEMGRRGLPVPPFFLLTTEAWRVFQEARNQLPESLWEETLGQLANLEKETGANFGNKENPLILSVRSGAPHSLPGMLKTVVNVGLNEETVLGLAKKEGEWCAWDSYRRAIESLATSLGVKSGEFTSILASLLKDVYQVSRVNDLPLEALKEAIFEFRNVFHQNLGQDFPQDPRLQLRWAIEGVFRSWDEPVVENYRKTKGIREEEGTAVICQKMVFGNKEGVPSGSGVYFTRHPQTGEARPQVAYGQKVQGVDIVGPESQSHLFPPEGLPEEFREELISAGQRLEEDYGFPQEIEFTFDGQLLWLLQTREAKLSPLALVATLRDGVTRGEFSSEEAVRRLTVAQIEALLTPGLDPQEAERAINEGRLLGQGSPLSPGIAQGKVVDDLSKAQKERLPVILVLEKITNAELTTIPPNVKGIILRLGSAGSHIAQLLRSFRGGIPAISGFAVGSLQFGDEVTLDAGEGQVFAGEIPLAKEISLPHDLLTFLKKCQESLRQNPWLAACYPVEKKYARESWEKRIEGELEEIHQRWRSPKAQTVALMRALIPEEFRMNYLVFKPWETPAMKRVLEEILKKGDEASVRACHSPPRLAQAPWQRISQKEEVKAFFQKDDFGGKYGGYPRWFSDTDLTEILIGQFPRGKLDPQLAPEHCVFTVSCQEGGVIIQIYPHSAQLRDLEQAAPEDLITVKADFDPEGRGNLGRFHGVNRRENLQSKNFTQLVIQKVFGEWWPPPLALPHALAALNHLTQLGTIDGQARIDPLGKSWCLIYDLKGQEKIE